MRLRGYRAPLNTTTIIRSGEHQTDAVLHLIYARTFHPQPFAPSEVYMQKKLLFLMTVFAILLSGCVVVQQDEVGVKRKFGKLKEATLPRRSRWCFC